MLGDLAAQGLRTALDLEPATEDKARLDLEAGDFRGVFDLNFMGAFLTSQAFARAMIAKGQGAIVTISSMSAVIPASSMNEVSMSSWVNSGCRSARKSSSRKQRTI